jgi:thiamine-phosphate pyrophosphorylase
MTDERLGGAAAGDPIWRALAALPRGSGVVFRHYDWPKGNRRKLLAQIAAVARRPRPGFGFPPPPARAGGVHRPAHAAGRGTAGSRGAGRGLVTASAHGRRELLQAFARGADLVFLSPVFPTRSHPGARSLGPVRFGLAVRGAPGPVIALGGLTLARARRMAALGAHGFAGIDCWLPDQPGISSARC